MWRKGDVSILHKWEKNKAVSISQPIFRHHPKTLLHCAAWFYYIWWKNSIHFRSHCAPLMCVILLTFYWRRCQQEWKLEKRRTQFVHDKPQTCLGWVIKPSHSKLAWHQRKPQAPWPHPLRGKQLQLSAETPAELTMGFRLKHFL